MPASNVIEIPGEIPPFGAVFGMGAVVGGKREAPGRERLGKARIVSASQSSSQSCGYREARLRRLRGRPDKRIAQCSSQGERKQSQRDPQRIPVYEMAQCQ